MEGKARRSLAEYPIAPALLFLYLALTAYALYKVAS